MAKRKYKLDAANELELWLESDVWPQQRLIYLGNRGSVESDESFNQVTPQMVEATIKNLTILDHQDPDRPICIIMNSPGGSVYDGLAIYDAIKETKCPVVIKCYGWCMSMATWILQAATARLVSPNCTLMVHVGSDGFSGHTNDFIRWGKEAERLNKLMFETYAERSGKPPKYWEKVCANDTFMTAQEAVNVGLADRIIAPAKTWSNEDPSEES